MNSLLKQEMVMTKIRILIGYPQTTIVFINKKKNPNCTEKKKAIVTKKNAN